MNQDKANKQAYGKLDSVCPNCKHVWIMKEYECPNQYFCTLNAEPRPKCGSIFMEEDFPIGNDEEWDRQFKIWDQWSIDNEVSVNGLCKFWEKHNESTNSIGEISS